MINGCTTISRHAGRPSGGAHLRLLSLAATVLGASVLSACAPMTVERAERECFQRARLTASPRGTVAVGVGSGGHRRAGISLEITSDYLQGRDPAAVYDACVLQKSGQLPSRPLYTRLDWKG